MRKQLFDGLGRVGLLLVLLYAAGPALAGFKLKNDDRVLIYGDRLADPQPPHTSFGMMAESFLRIKYPEFSGSFRHIGQKFKLGTEEGLAKWDSLAAPEKPTVIVLCFGMDDPKEEAYSEEVHSAFVSRLTEIVSKAKETGARLYMMTPPCPDVRRKSQLVQLDYENVMAKYAASVRGIAKENGAELLDWFSVSQARMKESGGEAGEMFLTNDGVRPTPEGAAIGARLMLEAFGAEPIKVEGTLDWKSLSCSINAGEISAQRLSEDKVQVNMSDVPIGWSPARGSMAFASNRALKDYYVFRLKITNGPEDGLVFGESGARATPVMGSMLEEGVELATSWPVVMAKESRELFGNLARRNETGDQIPVYEDRIQQEGLIEPELMPAAKCFIEFLHLQYEGYEKLVNRCAKRMAVTLEFARVPDSAAGEPTGGFQRAETLEKRDGQVDIGGQKQSEE